MEFFKYKNKLKPEKGRLLVSEPFLPDPNFERTIVLLCEHNDEGSFGFVLNKQSLVQISDVMGDLTDFSAPVYMGGPVQQDTLHYIHRLPDLKDAIRITDEIYWGGDFEKLTFLLNTKQVDPQDVKFFLGYSGWSAGQLELELEADSWIVNDQTSELLVFETNTELMWREALKNMGGRFSVYSNYPVDPSMN